MRAEPPTQLRAVYPGVGPGAPVPQQSPDCPSVCSQPGVPVTAAPSQQVQVGACTVSQGHDAGHVHPAATTI